MDKELFWNAVMLIGLISIFLSVGIAYYEFKGAERYCNSIEGDYNLDFFPLPPTHYCNNKILVQYSDGWDFERPDLKNIKINVP